MNRLPSRFAFAFAVAAALPALSPAAMLDVAGLSKADSPCDDFYDYANRHWLDATSIPDDRSGWGTFAIIGKRKAALDKLERMAVKVGYPDRWRDFSGAQVGDRPYAQNWINANAFEFARMLAHLGKPVDRGEWRMSPHIVNAQYDAYPGVDGLKVNGALTLGENIADLGGLRISWLALQRALAGKHHANLEGFSPDQRYFLAFAQAWRSRMRPEQERLRILTDSHSPPRYRVQGPLANLPEFARAFSCPAKAKALRTGGERVNLW